MVTEANQICCLLDGLSHAVTERARARRRPTPSARPGCLNSTTTRQAVALLLEATQATAGPRHP
jgi:hypothetical protein